MRKPSTLVLMSMIAAFAWVAPAAADTKLGVRGGYYTKIKEPFVGLELLTHVANRVYFNPNIEYVFVDGAKYFTVNGDFHYDFPTHRPYNVWAGAGVGLLRVDPPGADNSDTDVGLNLLAGVGFKTGSVVPYFQAKVILKNGSEFALGFGVRF